MKQSKKTGGGVTKGLRHWTHRPLSSGKILPCNPTPTWLLVRQSMKIGDGAGKGFRHWTRGWSVRFMDSHYGFGRSLLFSASTHSDGMNKIKQPRSCVLPYKKPQQWKKYFSKSIVRDLLHSPPPPPPPKLIATGFLPDGKVTFICLGMWHQSCKLQHMKWQQDWERTMHKKNSNKERKEEEEERLIRRKELIFFLADCRNNRCVVD